MFIGSLVLTVQLAASGAMFGLIWFVQVVHYPLFAKVGETGFVVYEQAHTRLTGYVVGPLMATETAAAAALPFLRTEGIATWVKVAGLVLVLAIHASTGLVQVPAHRSLSESYDAVTVRRLVRTNSIRTLGWTVRMLIAAGMVLAAIRTA